MRTTTTADQPTRRVTRYILIAIVLLALAIILWKMSDVLTVAFGGVVGAAVLRGLALPLARRTGLGQKWSLALVIFSLVVGLGLLGWLFGAQVANEAAEMQKLIPQAAHDLRDSLNGSAPGQAVMRTIQRASGESKALDGVRIAAGTLVTGLADVFLIMFLSIYFAFSPMEYLDGVLRLLPPRHRGRVKNALLGAGEALRQWLVAQLMAMVIVGVLVGTVLSFLHVPLAFLLGTLAALLEFIPVAGPILFSLPGIVVAFTKGPTLALYVLLAYVAVQQVEGNIIVPLLQRWAVRLPPALTLLSVLIGGLLLGPAGLVIATPLAVVVLALTKTLYVEETLEKGK